MISKNNPLGSKDSFSKRRIKMEMKSNPEVGKEKTNSAQEELNALIGKSWFERDQEFRRENDHQGITRILFISLVSVDSFGKDYAAATKIFNFIDSFAKNASSSVGGGLILLCPDREAKVPSSAIGFFEFQHSSLGETFLENLNELTSCGIHSIRIMLVSDDCPKRDFATSFELYSASPPEGEAENVDETSTVIFADFAATIRKYSNLFANSEPLSHCKCVKVLSGEKRKALPSANKVVRLARSDKFPSLEEFLTIFHKPSDFIENDNVSSLLPVVDWKQVRTIVDEAFRT